MGIIAVGIALANAPIASVNVKFGALIAGKFRPRSNGFLLRGVLAGSARRARLSDAPTRSRRYDMLPLLGHRLILLRVGLDIADAWPLAKEGSQAFTTIPP